MNRNQWKTLARTSFFISLFFAFILFSLSTTMGGCHNTIKIKNIENNNIDISLESRSCVSPIVLIENNGEDNFQVYNLTTNNNATTCLENMVYQYGYLKNTSQSCNNTVLEKGDSIEIRTVLGEHQLQTNKGAITWELKENNSSETTRLILVIVFLLAIITSISSLLVYLFKKNKK